MVNPIKNNKGAAIAVVVIAMAVLMILGTSVLNLGLSETKMSLLNEKDIQAEYIAKAGADIAAKYIADNPETNVTNLSDSLGKGNFDAVVTRPDSSTIKIVSTGTVDTSSKSVSLILKAMTYKDLFTGLRQTGVDALDLTAMNVEYMPGSVVNIEANVASLDQIQLSLADASDPNIVKSLNNNVPESFAIPDSAGYITELPIAVSGIKTFTGNYSLTTLTKVNGETLVFDTQGGNQYIIANTLSFTGTQGSVIIQGGGFVHLYIIDSGDIQNPISLNTDNPGTLFIYVSQGKSLTIAANGVINAYIYAPEATVEIQSALTTVKGALIGQIINRGNVNGAKGTFYYIPLPNNPSDNTIQFLYKKIMYLK